MQPIDPQTCVVDIARMGSSSVLYFTETCSVVGQISWTLAGSTRSRVCAHGSLPPFWRMEALAGLETNLQRRGLAIVSSAGMS